jgi:hypothetical protein
MRNQGYIPDMGKAFASPSKCPDRLWEPLSLLSTGRQGLFSRGKPASPISYFFDGLKQSEM